MTQRIIGEIKQKVELTIDAFKRDLSRFRTGRASHALVENIRVDAYGSSMPLSQVGTVTVPENRLIVIQPWDPSLLVVIEKAILKSDIGLTPQNDGKIIRLPIPSLTEERRIDLVKKAKHEAEEHRIAVRNIRREVNERLKRMKKDREVSEDDHFRLQDEVQKIVDHAIAQIDLIVAAKEKEMMEL